MISKWYAHHEKSSVTAMYTCGNQLGALIAFPLGPLFCPLKNVFGGWPLIFYFSGNVHFI
jgi:sugar phosphate permease